jgi:hypothetical protein
VSSKARGGCWFVALMSSIRPLNDSNAFGRGLMACRYNPAGFEYIDTHCFIELHYHSIHAQI